VGLVRRGVTGMGIDELPRFRSHDDIEILLMLQVYYNGNKCTITMLRNCLALRAPVGRLIQSHGPTVTRRVLAGLVTES
jgi:hypothetical protein